MALKERRCDLMDLKISRRLVMTCSPTYSVMESSVKDQEILKRLEASRATDNVLDPSDADPSMPHPDKNSETSEREVGPTHLVLATCCSSF